MARRQRQIVCRRHITTGYGGRGPLGGGRGCARELSGGGLVAWSGFCSRLRFSGLQVLGL